MPTDPELATVAAPEAAGTKGEEGERCLRWFFRVPRNQIGYVRFVVEAYEGLAQVTAIPGRNEVEWIVPEGLAEEAEQLSRALRDEVGLIPIQAPAD